ncbi:CARDB domain-containing protein, partial [Candidatus Bipolaricaulota bacterium]
GSISVEGKTFTVSQDGVSCSYSISPSSKDFGSSGGSGSVSVSANSGCSWTASSNDSWINVTSGSSGSGNGTVSYSVSSNSSSSSRSGSISVAGKTFGVSQDGASLPDLVVDDIWIDPNPPTPGGYVTIGVRVRNPSSVDIAGSFKLELYIDGSYQGRSTIYGLASSSTDTTYWSAMSWPSDTQPHTVRGVVDADSQIGESNESNNSRSESFSAEHSDTTPPSVVGTDPSDGEFFAMPTDRLVVSFDEDIVLGSGAVLMIDLDSRVIPVSWAEASGGNFIIHLTEELDYSSGYAVGLDAGAVRDLAGNPSDEYSWAFLTRAAVPGITGIDPATPTVNPLRQWIDVIGSGFVPDSQVTLRIGGSIWVIPPDRTEYVDSERLSIRVGLTDPGWWSAEVTNPDGATSNRYLFLVVE